VANERNAVAEKLPFLSELPDEVQSRIRKGHQPGWLNPMLATLAEEHFSSQEWLYEPKFDGVRCLVFHRENRTQLFSRNQKLLNEQIS